MKLSSTGTSPSLAAQSRTGSLYVNGEEVDQKLGDAVITIIQHHFAETPEEENLLEAMVRSAQTTFENSFHVSLDLRDNSLELKTIQSPGNSYSEKIKKRTIATVLSSMRLHFEKFVVDKNIWDAVVPKRYSIVDGRSKD
jgi:hypothetical protein